jgi:hypothetical protein
MAQAEFSGAIAAVAILFDGWERFFGDFRKRVPDIMDCRDDKGRFICKAALP